LLVNTCIAEEEKAMAGQRGRDVLISIGDGGTPEAFFAVAGIRAKTISLTAGLVEATTAQSPNAWREVISGAGVKRAEIAGNGVFKDSISDALMRAAYFAGVGSNFQMTIPDFGILTGPFVITELSYGGAHDDEATFSIRLASAGQVVFDVHGGA
jgi:TP901-1 family phage major tail protein